MQNYFSIYVKYTRATAKWVAPTPPPSSNKLNNPSPLYIFYIFFHISNFLAMCWRELGGMDWQFQAPHQIQAAHFMYSHKTKLFRVPNGYQFCGVIMDKGFFYTPYRHHSFLRPCSKSYGVHVARNQSCGGHAASCLHPTILCQK